MATRSTIVLKTKEGNYKSIYCHFDGYLSHNGKILYNNYNTYEKVEELISLGALSTLAENIRPSEGTVHNFENRQDNVCVFFHRDRQEDLDIFETSDFQEIFDGMEEYLYLFEDGKWKYLRCVDFDEVLKELEILKDVNLINGSNTNSEKYKRWESLTGDDKLNILKEVNALKELEPEDFLK